MRARLLPILSVLSLAGCTNAPVASETITRVRVLAIKSEPASILAGEHVAFDALAVTPVHDDPDLTITWYLCQFPSLDACARAKNLTVVGHGSHLELNAPATLTPGDSFVVWLDAIKGGQVERALKAVPVVAPTDARNHNPDFASVRFSNEAVGPDVSEMKANERVDVHAVAAGNPAEFYFDADENRAEDIQIHTYTTGGFLVDPSGTSASGELYYRAPQQNGDFGAWVVINDGRGGVDWRENWFNVTGAKKQ